MRRSLALAAAIAAIAVVLAAPRAEAALTAPNTWLSRINAYRAASGRTRLVQDHQASDVAQRWTNVMAATRALTHNPAYKQQVSTSWFRIGENIGSGRSEAVIFTAFTSSTGHRANMLRPEYNRVGIGQVVASGRLWTTHIFIATAQPTVAPAA